MAAHLGLEEPAFRARYGVRFDPDLGEPFIEAEGGAGCPLLGEAGCAVHAVKPSQCRTWPFWDELLEDELAWAAAKSECPGIDEGRLYSPAEIAVLRRGEGRTFGVD